MGARARSVAAQWSIRNRADDPGAQRSDDGLVNQPEEALMAICNIIDDAARSPEEHERITAHVRDSGPVPPEGCRLILLGRERAITVWDSPADRDRFLAERLGPAYRSVGRSLDEVTRSQFDVSMLLAGDLAGMTPELAGAEG
jgi:hypothetical protein